MTDPQPRHGRISEASLNTVFLDGQQYVKAEDVPAMLRQIAAAWEAREERGQPPVNPVRRLRSIAEDQDFMIIVLNEIPANERSDELIVSALPCETAEHIARSAGAYVEKHGPDRPSWDTIDGLRKLSPETGADMYRRARYIIAPISDHTDGAHGIRDRGTPAREDEGSSLLVFESYSEALDWRDNHSPRTDGEHRAMFPPTFKEI